MKFGLDWDGTTDKDVPLWRAFAADAKSRGHEVYIVTMRYPNERMKPKFAVCSFQSEDSRTMTA